MVGDQGEAEVVGEEGALDDRDADRQQGADGVDRAARGIDPAAIAARGAEQGCDTGVDGGQESQRQGREAEAMNRAPP
ncbi:MAG TPA: hypothetical protein VKA89_10350 [Solirubrobacterales bacterium]|nr:hypothetical protein [Solirubrobacterales bacterium]